MLNETDGSSYITADGQPTPYHLRSKRQQKIHQARQVAVASKRVSGESFVNQTPFRYVERIFKTVFPEPDWSSVIDFNNLSRNCDSNRKMIVETELAADLRALCKLFGAADDPEWTKRWNQAYLLKNVPGLIVIPNPFSPVSQRKIIKNCLRNSSKLPNISNLDTHYVIPPEGIWHSYEREWKGVLKEMDIDYLIPLKATARFGETDNESEKASSEILYKSELESRKGQSRMLINNLPGIEIDPNIPKESPEPSTTVPLLPASQLVKKLRWITLGYQYHWPSKTYHFDKRFEFPDDIGEISCAVVQAVEGIGYTDTSELGFEQWKNDYSGNRFKPEAGVINIYQAKDTLMAHVDRSELNMNAPLVSLSFGNTCVYLIGGITRDVAPIPIFLRSGDVLIMTGQSRLCYHGVPRILTGTLPIYLKNSSSQLTPSEDADDWQIFGEFLSEARININIRQVLKEDNE